MRSTSSRESARAAGLFSQPHADGYGDGASRSRLGALADWVTRHPRVGSAIATVVFCVLIAAGLASVFDGFVANLIVSLCIGLSMLASSFLVEWLLGDRVPGALVQLVAMPCGLASGLAFGGAYLAGDARFFFSGDGHEGVALGVLFGVIGSLGFFAFHALAHMRSELELRRLQGAEQARQLTVAHLRVLQAQMEPHFLFNTLSNVIGAIDTDPPRARELLLLLTALLRASLRRTRLATATLADELEVVEAYLRIQALRMGTRLTYAVHCPDDARDCALPPLMLQPLVENAVRHGVEPCEHGGHVEVLIERSGDTLRLTVRDTGIGLEAAAARTPEPREGGTSLPNLRDRLRTLYGDGAALTLHPNTPRGTTVQLVLPLAALRPAAAPETTP